MEGGKSEGEGGYLSEGHLEAQIKKKFLDEPNRQTLIIGRGDGKVKVIHNTNEEKEREARMLELGERELAIIERERILQEREDIIRENMRGKSAKKEMDRKETDGMKTDREHESSESEQEQNVYSKAHYYTTTPKTGKSSNKDRKRDRKNSDQSLPPAVMSYIDEYLQTQLKELKSGESRWLNQCSANIESTLPPPNLKNKMTVNTEGSDIGGSKQYRYLDWLKSHSGIKYNGNMPAFLRACSSFIDKAHPQMSSTEYNLFVVNLLDPTARSWVYQILDQSISTMEPTELHKWLTLTFNNGATQIDRKRYFYTYNPALDSSVLTFGDLLAKLKSLADAANIQDKEFFEKVRKCLPESAKTKLDITLGLAHIQNPTMKDIFLALAEQGQEISLHLNNRRTKSGYVNQNQHGKAQAPMVSSHTVQSSPQIQLPPVTSPYQSVQTNDHGPDNSPFAPVVPPPQTMPPMTIAGCNSVQGSNTFIPNNGKGKSIDKKLPKNPQVNYMAQSGAGYPDLNAKMNVASKTFQAKQLKMGTCPNCFFLRTPVGGMSF